MDSKISINANKVSEEHGKTLLRLYQALTTTDSAESE